MGGVEKGRGAVPDRLKLFSIFNSISGEAGGVPQGALMTFIRFAGCNLRCLYCDTDRAISSKSGYDTTVQETVEVVKRIGCHKVLITGGEPLMQKKAFEKLVQALNAEGYYVQVETNGSYQMSNAIGVDCWVADYKLHGSRESDRMLPATTFAALPTDSIIKFVCTDRLDFEQAVDVVQQIKTLAPTHAELFFGAAAPLEPSRLVEWMQQARLWDVALNTQIHKWVFPKGEREG